MVRQSWSQPWTNLSLPLVSDCTSILTAACSLSALCSPSHPLCPSLSPSLKDLGVRKPDTQGPWNPLPILEYPSLSPQPGPFLHLFPRQGMPSPCLPQRPFLAALQTKPPPCLRTLFSQMMKGRPAFFPSVLQPPQSSQLNGILTHTDFTALSASFSFCASFPFSQPVLATSLCTRLLLEAASGLFRSRQGINYK